MNTYVKVTHVKIKIARINSSNHLISMYLTAG